MPFLYVAVRKKVCWMGEQRRLNGDADRGWKGKSRVTEKKVNKLSDISQESSTTAIIDKKNPFRHCFLFQYQHIRKVEIVEMYQTLQLHK